MSATVQLPQLQQRQKSANDVTHSYFWPAARLPSRPPLCHCHLRALVTARLRPGYRSLWPAAKLQRRGPGGTVAQSSSPELTVLTVLASLTASLGTVCVVLQALFFDASVCFGWHHWLFLYAFIPIPCGNCWLYVFPKYCDFSLPGA